MSFQTTLPLLALWLGGLLLGGLLLGGLAACSGDFAASVEDAGAPPPDAGTPPPDAGTPPPDAGTTPPDAGTTPPDASAGVDGGDLDGGATFDAGAESDAGPECPVGTLPPSCVECAPGYQDEDDDGTCELGCDATGEDALDCGEGSACEVDATTGERGCVCLAGYESVGGACVLDLPPTTNLSLWLDADNADSLVLAGGPYVAAWSDRRPSFNLTLAQSDAGLRPGHVPSAQAGRGAVRFAGDDSLLHPAYWGLSTDDYEIIIAGQPLDGGGINGILSATDDGGNWSILVDNVGTGYRFTHRNTAEPSGTDEVVVERTEALQRGWVVATHQSSVSIDTLAVFASDGSTDAIAIQNVTPSSGTGSSMTLRLGQTANGTFLGDIYEVLIYTRRLTVDERREVTDYLRAKWNLP